MAETTTKSETEAGSYFVANYPPFAFWGEDDIPCIDAILNSPTPGEKIPLGLYMHIPFCRKRCHFCYFRVYTDKNAGEIREYLDAAMAELEIYANKPYLQGRKPKFVYFGGGTPSYLSAQQLASLTERMQALIPWDEAEEVTFECEPGTLNENKLRAIRDMGITRLSLGVENFSDHILETNGRAHRTAEIQRAYDFARSINFPQINIDLISGMLEETEANWQECVSKTIELSPDCVTIYQMEVPYNTTIYKRMKEEGKLTAPVADWKTKRRWVDYAFDQLQDAGYTVTSAYTVVKDPENTKFVYRDRLWTGADLLSLGVASFGHLGGIHYQNKSHIGDYTGIVHSDKLPHHRALMTSEEERFLREFILQMKTGRASQSYFQQKFGENLRARFEGQFTDLQNRGFLKMEREEILLTRPGLLQVDELLHSFFLSRHMITSHS
jgi:oxygen-independent coproporphyrinogen-3 oxidase